MMIFLCFRIGIAQSVQASFSVPAQGCLEQNIQLINTSTNADRYEWDFCQGDLSLAPTASTALNLGGNVTTGIDLIYDGVNWFGFIADQNNNSIIRLEFGSDISAIPLITNLGNIDGKINSPTDIKIINENGNWFGFVYGLSQPLISRINFGSSLSNTTSSPTPITATSVINGAGSTNGGFDMIREDGNWMLVLTYFSSAKIAKLSSITSIPTGPEIMDIPSFGLSLGDLVLQFSNGIYYAYTVDFGNQTLYELNFGASIFTAPMVTNLNANALTGVTPYGIDIGYDANKYFLFISTLQGSIVRVELGNDLSSPSVNDVSLGNFGTLENTLKIKLIKNQSRWVAFAPSWNTSNLFRIDFSEPACEISPGVSTFDEPIIKYIITSDKAITLRAFTSNGEFSEFSKILPITTDVAPDISILYNNYCIGSTTDFDVSSSLALTTYDWDFGDLGTSTLPSPSHLYSSVGDYSVSLAVTALNNCQNITSNIVRIANEPVPDFNVPLTTPICTNQDYLFTNTSVFDPGSNPSWQWEVNGVPISTTQDFTYSIPTAVMQDVKLKASIPGCENEIIKTINTVEDGPAANFTFANDCEDKSIDFINTTTGIVTGYSWDFGDGNNSIQTNGTNAFADFGQYNVTLAATNAAGCVNTSVQEITIYSNPQPNFSIDLPPFSCAGSSSQFNDLTPNPTDSNLAGWTWSFGDPLNGTSNVRNAVYTFSTAAQYDVTLEVSTNFGCKASVQKAITISQSPDPAFSFNPACVNQATIFTPTSTSGVSSWQWKIGTSTYNQQNPTHVFSFPSAYTAKLTVTGANGCVAVLTKPVIVPTAASVDFISENNCATQNASFTDLTTTSSDPISIRTWQFGTLGAGTGMTPTFNFPTSGSYPVKLTVTSEAGCSYSISKNVNIVNAPVVTFNATPLTGVPPLTVKFQNTSANSIAQLWKVNDADNSTSTENSPSFIFNELGQYVVDLTVVNVAGCANTLSKVISVITPSLDIELVNLTLLPANNGETNLLITLLNKSNSPVSNIKAIIDVAGEALISEVINAVVLPGETYSQILSTGIIGSKGNADFVCVELAVDGDVNYSNNKRCINSGSTIVVFDPYPNPGSDQLNLDWVANSSGKSEVYIFDRTGRKVFDNTISNYVEGFNHLTISLTSLNPGLYYVFFVSDGSRKSFPFVLRR